MIRLKAIALVMVFAAIFAGTALAQKKTSARTTTAKSSAPKTTSTLPPLDVRAARVKVSNQASNVAQFINIMGPIAQSIEALDGEARTRKIAQASADANTTTSRSPCTRPAGPGRSVSKNGGAAGATARRTRASACRPASRLRTTKRGSTTSQVA